MVFSEGAVLVFARVAALVGHAPDDPRAVLQEVEARLLSMPTDASEESAATKRLQLRVHLLQQEIDGLREAIEGLERAVTGGGKSYRASRQSQDLLQKDLDDKTRDYSAALKRGKALAADVERLQVERMQLVAPPRAG